MEVVEVGVAAIGLPALFTAVLVASVHSDGVQRVGLAVVIANPCSTPEARETSISYRRCRIISNNGSERRMCGGRGRGRKSENREEKRKVGACSKSKRRKSNKNKECSVDKHSNGEMVEKQEQQKPVKVTGRNEDCRR